MMAIFVLPALIQLNRLRAHLGSFNGTTETGWSHLVVITSAGNREAR